MSLGPGLADIEGSGERQFYLEEFRGRTLLFAVPANEISEAAEQRALADVLRALAANGTRVVLMAGSPEAGEPAQHLAECLGGILAAVPPPFAAVPVVPPAAAEAGNVAAVVAEAWGRLRQAPAFACVIEAADTATTHRCAAHLAVRLRVHKLVLVDPAGGLAGGDGRVLSFLDEAALGALLEAGEAEWTGLSARLAVVASARGALLQGVASVNVCTLPGVARELFTYEGSGTLFTLADYCHVERLGIDDFSEAERLIERGQREGVLKPRTTAEIAHLLANGYGATIAAHHLAGFCAFVSEPYREQGAGEIVGLYTITRFKGEGVGDRLVDRILADARNAGLRYVFATTTSARAQAFFERRGFRHVDHDAVPPLKWADYDDDRRRFVAALRLDLRDSAD